MGNAVRKHQRQQEARDPSFRVSIGCGETDRTRCPFSQRRSQEGHDLSENWREIWGYEGFHLARHKRKSVGACKVTGRKTEEWVASHPDQKIPPRVRLRVFDAHGGKCAISGRKIQSFEKWECDHRVALINGGEHRESNLQPVLVAAHRAKTRADVAEKSTVARKRAKHLGLHKPKSTIPGSRGSKWKRRLDGTVVRRGE